MQNKTIKRLKYKKSALERSASAYGGAFKILSLLARAEPSDVSSVVANNDALEILQHVKGNF